MGYHLYRRENNKYKITVVIYITFMSDLGCIYIYYFQNINGQL